MASSTHPIYISVLEQVGMSLNGIAYLMKVFFFQAGVPSCSDNVTHRSCANFKYEVADVNNGIPIDLWAIKCLTVESGQPCRDNISWYIQLDWFVQQLFSLDSICMMFTTRDWLLWLPVDHSRQPVTLKWDGEKPWIGVIGVFFRKIFDLRIVRFFLRLIKQYVFQIR